MNSGRILARSLFVLGAVFVVLLTTAPGASAHPLGNFTVNSYSGVHVQPDAVTVQLVVDSAEIPTVQEFPDAGSGGVSDESSAAYGVTECDRLAPGLMLTLDGARQPLAVTSADLTFRPGQAGLLTMRLECQLETASEVETTGRTLEYVDRNSLDRTGWREITLNGDGVTLADSTTQSESVSATLTAYPADLLASPLDQRSATTRVTPGSGVASNGRPDVSGEAGSSGGGGDMGVITKAFTDLVAARELGIGFATFALGLSILLGALHAFAPGHGKTLMAAYLLGQKSSLRQVGIIGLTVTLTHTAGVLVLGVVLSTIAIAAPERVYGWLGLASGLLLIGIGATLLRQAMRRSPAEASMRTAELAAAAVGPPGGAVHDHGHGDGHGHGHGQGRESAAEVTHSHGWGGSHTHPAPATSARGLVAVGLAGGMVPSPSALVVLLGGIALGRAWFGVLLVLGYGIGMALALIGTGLVLARSRDQIARWAERHRREGQQPGVLLRGLRHLPAAAAVMVMIVGLGLVARAATGL